MPNVKTCIECQGTYPCTPEFFHRSKDGFHARCRKCRNANERGGRKKVANKRLARIERKSLESFIKAAKAGGTSVPHSAELLEQILTYFGGVNGFATAWMKQFYDAPAGGAFRTKMLDGVFRLVQTNTAMGGAKKPLELMTEEELESELRRRVLEAAMTIRKVEVVNEVPRLPVVDPHSPGVAGGGVPAVPATSQREPLGVPVAGQVPALRRVDAADDAAGQ